MEWFISVPGSCRSMAKRRGARRPVRVLLAVSGTLALLVGVAAITSPSGEETEEAVAGFSEALGGSILVIGAVLMADRSKAVVAIGIVCGTLLVLLGGVAGVLAGAGALAAGVWAYSAAWS